MVTTRSFIILALILTQTTTSAQEIEGQFFDSNGVQIHYVDVGAGEPVVLMHGLNSNYQEGWFENGIAEKLIDAGFRVLALDARAHGQSGTPTDPQQYGREMSLDIVRLLDHLGVDKAHVVGYSMGAQIAAKMRDLEPNRFITLCIGGAGWVKHDGPEAWQVVLADSLEQGDGFMSLYNSLYPDWSVEDREARSAHSVAALADVHATAALLRGWNFRVAEESLRANSIPTLAIIGSTDPMKPTVDALHGIMQNMETVVIEGADHLAALAHPDYAGSLIAFLNKHSTK